MGLFDFLKRGEKRTNPEDSFNVTITDESVTVEHPQRAKEQIKWTEIESIKIITTDEGPFLPDVWIALLGRESGCMIPQGAKGYDEIYNMISKYEHFNFENVIAAMSSTDNQEFLVWSKGESL
jgi:hypothetical protein